tara:strand:+ start:886 stop:1284 length:399 start_codon:yes stop_codon:yes gene_type:complete
MQIPKVFYISIILITGIFREGNSKNYDLKTFLCADEIGPRIEISVPKFNKDLIIEKFFFKLYSLKNRKLFESEKGLIEKKSSPIDSSYFFYTSNFLLTDDETKNLYFEFFPPSTMMLKTGNSQFKSLACWEN